MNTPQNPEAVILGDQIIIKAPGLTLGQLRRLATAYVAIAAGESSDDGADESEL
jgi:hypothetical protein